MSKTILIVLIAITLLNLIQFIFLLATIRRLKQRNEEFELEQRYSQEIEQELSGLKSLYADAIQSINTAVPDFTSDSEVKEPDESSLIDSKAALDAEQIIQEAKKNAESIVAEAHQRARSQFKRQERELNKSLSKLVVQVAKKVTGRDLDYEKHKEIIMQMLDEL